MTNLNDRQLQQLLRMAAEAEELAESSLQVMPASRTWSAGGRRRTWVGISSLAAAAALALGVFVALPSRPPAPLPTDGGLAIAPTIDELPIDPPPAAPVEKEAHSPVRLVTGDSGADPEQSVLFAIFRDPGGDCSCVQLRETDWGDKRLADVGRDELLAAALGDPCTTLAGQVLIVGVSGRPGSVPTTRLDAETLATRLAHVPMSEHQDVSLAAYAALPQLPPGSTVVAEAVSFYRR